MNHILNHNRTPFVFRLDRSEYWDFFLAQEEMYFQATGNGELTERCLSSYVDTSDLESLHDESLFGMERYTWSDAVNKGVTLSNIGYTGVDNGFITFKKDRITNEEFIELFTQSSYSIDENDVRLRLNPVNGNNGLYDYPMSYATEDGVNVSKLGGGFYQGFFKSSCDYHILPSNVGTGIGLEFTFKKTDSVSDDNTYTLNDKYPDNKGTFFYIGTRAENKWWVNYDVSQEFDNIYNEYFTDDYSVDGYISESLNDGYFADNPPLEKEVEIIEKYSDDDYFSDGYQDDSCDTESEYECHCKQEETVETVNDIIFTHPEYLNTYQENSKWRTVDGGIWVENQYYTMEHKKTCAEIKKRYECNPYFADDYLSVPYDSCKQDEPEECDSTDYMAEPDYYKPDAVIDPDADLSTVNGHSIHQPNIIEIKSDNKFLLFDRTPDGFTTDTWVEGSEALITDIKMPTDENYFLLFHGGCGGMTTDNFTHQNKRYDVLNDVFRNAFALQVKDDGSIGYKYMVQDCESEEKAYKIESEFSNPGIINDDEWVTVNVQIKPLGKVYDKNAVVTSESQKVIIYIYVNGKLVFISKELPTFNFRELNDTEDKQEGVPFNISVGGGSQGLADVIYYNFRKLPEKQLPIEKEFGGSFIGYFKSFKFYDCNLTFSEITQNAIFEKRFLTHETIY